MSDEEMPDLEDFSSELNKPRPKLDSKLLEESKTKTSATQITKDSSEHKSLKENDNGFLGGFGKGFLSQNPKEKKKEENIIELKGNKEAISLLFHKL